MVASIAIMVAGLAFLANAANGGAPTGGRGQLAPGSPEAYLLLGIFLSLLIVAPAILLLTRKIAVGTKAVVSLLACAAMAVLYWIAGGGGARSWLAAGWG